MRVFKNKGFHNWAEDESLTDEALWTAVNEMAQGLIDAKLGGNVMKKRVPIRGRGKSGGLRTLIAFKRDDKAFFIYGFSKSEKANISGKELKALKVMAEQMFGYSPQELTKALKAGVLIEVMRNEEINP